MSDGEYDQIDAENEAAYWDKKEQEQEPITYPEHEKLSKVSDKSQVIGEFLDWLSDERNIHLGEYKEDSAWDWMWPVRISNQDLLAEFFDIDLKVLEDEKCAMLDEIRAS